MDGTIVRGPLLFFPVEIELVDQTWNLNLRKDVNLTFNKSLLLAYAYYNNSLLDEDLIERVFDDFDRDIKGFRTSLYKILKDSPVEINFNQELFIDELHAFKEFRKDEFEETEKNGELKMYPEAVLGIFPQSGSYLVPDYLHMIEKGNYGSMEDFFEEHSFSDETEEDKRHLSFFYFLNKIKEEQTFTPFKMDAYQENALKAVKKGNSIVVQGPPGTGKSQLICNLASDFMARGMNVLIVCQKRAALDVVYERLHDHDMTDFVALVHDFKNDRKAIYEQIRNQIDSLYEYKLKNNSLDAIQIERSFTQSSRLIDTITEDFEELKFALYDESESGLSIKELYLTSDLNQPYVNLKQEYNYFKLDQVHDFLSKLRYYAVYARKFNREGYPWKLRKDFSKFQIEDLKEIVRIIRDIHDFQSKLDEGTFRVVNANVSFVEGESILGRKEALQQMFDLLKEEEAYRNFKHYLGNQPKDADLLYITNIEKNLMSCYEDVGIEATINSNELGEFQAALQKMLEARRSLYKWIKWQLFSKDRARIQAVLEKNKLTVRRSDLKILTRKLDNRLNLEHNLSKLRGNSWLVDIPIKPGRKRIQDWFLNNKNAIRAKDIYVASRNFAEYVNPGSLTYQEFKSMTSDLFLELKDIPMKRLEWEAYLQPMQILQVMNHKYELNRYIKVLEDDFSDLCDFDRLAGSLLAHEKQAVARMEEVIDQHSPDASIDIFLNSLKLAWIDHIEAKYPILSSVSTLKFEPRILELQNAVKEKLRTSQEIVLMRSRERTYQEVEYNRLNNMTTYRDLQHQVTKKRKIWPIRRLISHYSRELFNLLPCWLTSPEAASAIFPMERIFDVVIFDEASQCYVERGLPAVFRGKQVVIAGDGNQLSPFDLYKTRWEGDDDETPELEVDSLLDLAEKFLMKVQLRGHYRSQSIDLIDFSNQHFYHGNLTLLPDRLVVNRSIPAIDFVKVNGVWEKNANVIEAEKVVDLMFDLFEREKGKTLGVISFNARQQELIMDLAEDRAISEKKLLPETLFIKNIENVQGDERDIIIFSITHGPDPSGKLSMQFGTLNVIKGENRLNVAITRAREKIYIVASFFPQEMKTDTLTNEGPKLLKKYLDYALEVSQGRHKPAIKPPVYPRNGWYLKNRLAADLNEESKFVLKACEEMPFADLTLKDGNQYKAIIMTDDDHYFQSITPKEIHVYEPLLFSAKNWKVRGVFSREYWARKEEVIERLIRFSNQLDD